MQNKTRISTFRDWLTQHEYEDSPVGDLAKDTLADNTWLGDSYLSLHEHLLLRNAGHQVFEALDMADSRFMVEHPDQWLKLE